MQEKLIFLIGPPRSGSTLLMRMLSSHSQIYSRPEPHLLTPLAHLGYWDNVDRAPFDQLQAGASVRQFVQDLPNGEADYIEALQAYAHTMYGRILETQDKPFFLDKTPAYGLILPFIERVFPQAHFVVLTRNPCSETTLAVQEAYRRSHPGEKVPFAYTTSNTKLQKKLGVSE